MRRHLSFSVIACAVILAGAGCTNNAIKNTSVAGTQTSANNASQKIVFMPPASLTAVEGTPYSYSFCKPDSARSGATCGGLAGATQNPIWGNPPYSFSHQFNTGALPPGLALGLNGLLKGTPTLAGKYTFGICASDSTGQACGSTTVTVKPKTPPPPPPPPPELKRSLIIRTSGTGSGTVSVDPKGTNMKFADGTSVTLKAVPATGSTFDHWEDGCKGQTGSCMLAMILDRTATAVFTLKQVTPPPATINVSISALSCAWTTKTDAYGNTSDCARLTSNGTAQGPVGAQVSLPHLAWSDDVFTCGSWTRASGSSGVVCIRKDGQPETTQWTADTGGEECPLKEYFRKSTTYIVDVSVSDGSVPPKEARKTATCQ